MKSNVVIFDKPYSEDKIAEGRAVQWAVVSGACNRCNHLQKCENDNNFEFPQNAKNVSRGTCDATYKQENV